uniref:Transmembrane protein n=1 Tax=Steinernema glaseri TaxID=37863 RepID=A0A1I8ARH3_9BILA
MLQRARHQGDGATSSFVVFAQHEETRFCDSATPRSRFVTHFRSKSLVCSVTAGSLATLFSRPTESRRDAQLPQGQSLESLRLQILRFVPFVLLFSAGVNKPFVHITSPRVSAFVSAPRGEGLGDTSAAEEDTRVCVRGVRRYVEVDNNMKREVYVESKEEVRFIKINETALGSQMLLGTLAMLHCALLTLCTALKAEMDRNTSRGSQMRISQSRESAVNRESGIQPSLTIVRQVDRPSLISNKDRLPGEIAPQKRGSIVENDFLVLP